MNKVNVSQENYFEELTDVELQTAYNEYLVWRESKLSEGVISKLRRRYEQDNRCISGVRHFTESLLYVYARRFAQ